MKDNRWIVCPMCGRGRKLLPAGKERASFVVLNPHHAPCIDFRDISGGRGSGFPRIGTMTIEEMKEDPEKYMAILVEMREQAQSILDAIGEIDDTGYEVSNEVD